MMRLFVIAAGFAACSLVAPMRPAAANPAAAAQSGEVLLLDFAASWCGPCKQMAPIVAEVASAGWVVRHVDVDRETDLVRRFGVTGVPCYVLLVKGHEVGRINGATTRCELEQLLSKSREPLGLAALPATPAAASMGGVRTYGSPICPMVWASRPWRCWRNAWAMGSGSALGPTSPLICLGSPWVVWWPAPGCRGWAAMAVPAGFGAWAVPSGGRWLPNWCPGCSWPASPT